MDQITRTSVVAHWEVIPGKERVRHIGLCWDINTEPTLNDSYTYCDRRLSRFDIPLKDLKPNTTYYIRAFATSDHGTVYGKNVSFQTSENDPCDQITYVNDIQLIIANNCVSCHSNPFPSGGLDLSSYSALLAADPVRLQARITDPNNPMPPNGLMAQSDIDKVICWLGNGRKP
jgi:hypothetical protein